MTEAITAVAARECVAMGRGHGTPSGWFNGGRCLQCRRAHNRDSRNRRGLQPGQREEVLGALRAGLTVEESAARVGTTARSLQAAGVRDGELRAAMDHESLARQLMARQGDLIATMIRLGGSRRQACQELGIPIHVAEKWARDPYFGAAEKAVVEWMRAVTGLTGVRAKVTDAALDQAVELLRSKMPLTQVAQEVGLSVPTLKKYRRTHPGLDAAIRQAPRAPTRPAHPAATTTAERPKRKRGPEATPESDEQLRRMWIDTSMTKAEIAAALGVNKNTLTRRARRLGLPDRNALRHGRVAITPKGATT